MIESPFPQRSRKRARSVSSPASETAQPADEEHPGTRQSVAPSDSQPSASTVPAAIPSSSQTAIQSFQEVEEPLSKLLKEEHDDGNETEIIDDVEAASDGAVDRAGSS